MAAYVSCPALLIRFLNANFSCVVDGHSEELCYPGPGTGNDDDDEQSQPPIKKYLELLGRIDCRKYPPITYTNTWRKKDIANKLLEPLKLPLYRFTLPLDTSNESPLPAASAWANLDWDDVFHYLVPKLRAKDPTNPTKERPRCPRIHIRRAT